MVYVWIIVGLSALAQGWALREALAGTSGVWLALGLAYVIVGGLGLRRLWENGTLLERLRPRGGDITLGALTAALLLVGSWAMRSLVVPMDSPRYAWLLRLELVLGNPNLIQRSARITITLLLIAVLDEIAWRGCVLGTLTERYGTRRAFLYAVLLYGAAALPTVVTLSDPVAGLNPLWAMLTLATGLFWTFLARLTGRLPPSIVSHAIFAYFSMVFGDFSAARFRVPGLVP
jgi:membrane protease YdiL (CAAX protease family)